MVRASSSTYSSVATSTAAISATRQQRVSIGFGSTALTIWQGSASDMTPEVELHRLSLQSELDAGKTQAERNKLGQFATPTDLARHVLKFGVSLLGDAQIRFLDPAIGTGSFYSALRRTVEADRIGEAVGY